MGHERIGLLPKSKAWRDIVAAIAGSVKDKAKLSDLADATINQVRDRFGKIQKDSGVKAALKFLISLSTASAKLPKPTISNYPEIDFSSNFSTFLLAKKARSWINLYVDSQEYADIAQKSAIDTITLWTNKQRRQRILFAQDDNIAETWRKAGSGSGFCEVSRLFFAKFTERYLKYFIEREASSVLPTIQDRENLSDKLCDHIDTVSKHAFETSKITQSFAAGWFNKHAKKQFPSDSEIESFLSVAFGKLREELWREANS